MDNIILFDWLTFSIKSLNNIEDIFTILGLADKRDKFNYCNGRNFFRQGLVYGNIITILFDYYGNAESCNNLIQVELTGQGCRFFDSNSDYDFNYLFNFLISCGVDVNISRLDVALDVFDKSITTKKIYNEYHKLNFISKMKKHRITESYTPELGFAYSIYFGSKSSNCEINIYDKGKERGFTDDEKHIIRFEIRLRDCKSYNFVHEYINSNYNIGYCYFGALNYHLRFIKNDDSNKSRCSNANWWNKILKYSSSINLVSHKATDYDFDKFKEYFVKNCGSTILTAYQIAQGDLDLLYNFLRNSDVKINDSQDLLIERLIDDYYDTSKLFTIPD